MKSLGYLDFIQNLALKKCNRIERHSFLIEQKKKQEIQESIKISSYHFQQIVNIIHIILSEYITKQYHSQQPTFFSEKLDVQPQPCLIRINKQIKKQINFKVQKVEGPLQMMKKSSNKKGKAEMLISLQKFNTIIQDEQINKVRIQKQKSDNIRKIELQFLKRKRKYECKVQEQKQNKKNNNKLSELNKNAYTFDFNGQLIKQKKKPELKRIDKKKQFFEFKLSKSQSLAKNVPFQEVIYQKNANFNQKQINFINWKNQSSIQKINPINVLQIQKGISISIYKTNVDKQYRLPTVSQNYQNKNVKCAGLLSNINNINPLIYEQTESQVSQKNKYKNILLRSILNTEQ